jgi:carboxyl-terminal processing protease
MPSSRGPERRSAGGPGPARAPSRSWRRGSAPKPRPARVALVAGLLAVLIGGAAAQPAPPIDPAPLDLFDEAAYHLAFYAGPAETPPRELLPAARAELEARCARPAGCTVGDAVDALADVIAELDDGHTALIPEDAFQRLRLQLGGGAETDSFGVVVAAPANGLGLVVTDVVPGSPGEAAGLARGDRVLALDGAFLPAGRRARLQDWSEAEQRGRVEALQLRAGAAPRRIELRAAPLRVDRVPSLDLLPGDVAWLRIPSFLLAGVAQRVHDLVRRAEAAGATGLVVDVRDNPGGFLLECLASAGAFADAFAYRVQASVLPQTLRWEDGVLAVVDLADRAFPQSVLEDRVRWRGPTVVLVNAGSASCAEHMAYALQRYGDVPVIGETTAGVLDSATNFVALSNGMGLAVSVARIADGDGTVLPRAVSPDRALADDLMALASGRDALLAAAVERLLDR